MRVRGFTLIELIVTIAIFGIIMSGVMNMVQPINDSAATAKILNEQRTVEEAVTSYIGSNLRYATNLLIVEDGAEVGGVNVSSPAKAIDAFFKFAPVNTYGEPLDKTANRNNVDVIVWDGTINKYSYVNNTYTGRLITAVSGRTTDPDLSDLDPTGAKSMYLTLGDAYYGPGDFYLNVKMTKSGYLGLECSSEYYYSNGAKRGFKRCSDTGNLPTEANIELRNFGISSHKFNMALKEEGSGINSTRIEGKVIYFVFTPDECADWPVDATATDEVNKNFKDGKSNA